MAPPNFPFDEKMLPRYPIPSKSMSTARLDFLSNLSLDGRLEVVNGCLPTIPLLPNLKLPSLDVLRGNQQDEEEAPSLDLGRVPPAFSTFPENHRKVLENIMMRTGSGSANYFRRKPKGDGWSEDELDSLWIGVRRHGKGNWDVMLKDPRLKFSRYKTPEDISSRWEEEQLKILDGSACQVPKAAKQTKLQKSSLFPNLPDGMMARALHGSRLVTAPKFHTHLTDIKLGLGGDLASNLPKFEAPDRLGLQNEQFATIPTWNHDKYRIYFPGESSAGPSDRSGTNSNLPVENPFTFNSLGTSCLGLNCSRSFDTRAKENDEPGLDNYGKLPNLLDGSLKLFHESPNNLENSGSGLLPDSGKGLNFANSKEEITESSSSKDRLPHWLREAVNVSSKPPDPNLPPSVSAVAQSVRLLYGEDKFITIPPFVNPGPPPSLPKDPRRCLKKKRKRRSLSFRHIPEDTAGSSQPGDFESPVHRDATVSCSISLLSPLAMHSQAMTGTPGLPGLESDLSVPALNLNMNPPSSSLHANQQKKTSMGLSPSPEVLQLVASCVTPGSHMPSLSGKLKSSLLEKNLPISTSHDQEDLLGLKSSLGKSKKQRLSFSSLDFYHQDKPNSPDSDDSSKTQSDPSRSKRPDGEEISSEGTVSDRHVSDQEL